VRRVHAEEEATGVAASRRLGETEQDQKKPDESR
jgi:hypothetical protein